MFEFKKTNKKETFITIGMAYVFLIVMLFYCHFNTKIVNFVKRENVKSNSFYSYFGKNNDTLQSISNIALTVSNQIFESNFDKWLNTFKAKNPEYQEYCLNALKTNVAESQFSQDMWLFNNIFKFYALQNNKGFYVDSGANDWKYFSNTFFYDVCLGWDGLCIEPNANYHDGLRKYRSCKLITECISDKAEKKGFVNAGGGSHVIDGDLLSCNTLTSMLGNQKKVDLWSLDVEKHELEILGKVDFKSIEVSVLLVEDFWLPYGSLDSLLLNGSTGFLKMTQMPVDSVFVHRNMFRNIMNNIEEYWYPSNWNDYVEDNKAFREQKIKENVLTY